MGKEEQNQILECFDLFDGDKMGNITVKDAKRAMKHLGVEVKRDEIRAWLGEQNSHNNVDRDAFFRIACATIEQQQVAEKAFGLFDKDNKGLVCFEDLLRVAGDLGEDFSQAELQEMVRWADRNGEGLVNREDFFRIARKIKL